MFCLDAFIFMFGWDSGLRGCSALCEQMDTVSCLFTGCPGLYHSCHHGPHMLWATEKHIKRSNWQLNWVPPSSSSWRELWKRIALLGLQCRPPWVVPNTFEVPEGSTGRVKDQDSVGQAVWLTAFFSQQLWRWHLKGARGPSSNGATFLLQRKKNM